MTLKKFESLMFITPEKLVDELVGLVSSFLEAGGKWVQLRLKEADYDTILEAAILLNELCRKYEAVFIINDNPEIAKKVNANGVHLGKKDMPVKLVRDILGDDFIVGGTANTIDDMIALANSGSDYIGLGPFSFTTTKKNLSAVLGVDGYSNLITEFRKIGYHIPVTAIGGITTNDINSIMQTGVNGVAVCGLISSASDVALATEKLLHEINIGIAVNVM
jgi:thiamine-phosphate pyrophosphorylase